jgi:hypothetical protein
MWAVISAMISLLTLGMEIYLLRSFTDIAHIAQNAMYAPPARFLTLMGSDWNRSLARSHAPSPLARSV